MVVVTRVAILAVLAASAAVVPASAKADDVDAEDAPAADTSRDYSGDVDWSGPAWCAPSCAEWGCVGSLCDACALHAPGGGPGCQCVACACAPGRPVCDEICRLVAASGNEIFLQACDDGTSCRCDATR